MIKKQKRLILAIFNAAAFIGVVTINALANALPINGYNTGELSDMYPNVFVPAGFTFSIWGIIYLLLGVFIAYQLVIAIRSPKTATEKTESDGFIEKIGVLFIISSAANIGWIFAWHFTLVGISFIFMAALLIALIALYVKLNIRKRSVQATEKWFVFVPFVC